MNWRTAVVPLMLVLPAAAALAAVAGGGGAEGGEPTSGDVLMLVLYVLLALVVSFLCSIAEAVLLSITPSYIEELGERHPGRAKLVRRLKQERVDQSLAAILTLNTIAHTIGAIGAGAKATVVFGSAWFGLFSAVMTLLILFLSEIVPKTVGAVHWARLVHPTALFVRGLVLLLYPMVWVSEKITRLIARGKTTPIFSREEFLAMARIGEQTGQIRDEESRIIRNLFRFNMLKVEDIMTPRTVIVAFPEDFDLAEALHRVADLPFSRIPVYRESIDHITGFVLKDDILLYRALESTEGTLAELKREIHPIPESTRLPVLFETLLERREHIAVAVDEHGGTQGLVTLEDLVETLMGMEIMDETDSIRDMRALARGRWEKRRRQMGL